MNASFDFAIAHRWLVLVLALALAALGVWNFQRLPIDAVPDITNVQVQINTEAPGYSPLEAEQRITFPIETAMAGLPDLEYTRSLSRYGLSQVTVVFEDGTDIYFARQLVNERLQQAQEPAAAGHRAEHGPDRHRPRRDLHVHGGGRSRARARPDGKPYTPTDLRTLQDWVVRPQLRNVPGVIEVNTDRRLRASSIHVTPDPERLVAYGLSLRDVMDGARSATTPTSAPATSSATASSTWSASPGQVASIEEIRRHRRRASRRRADPRCATWRTSSMGKELRTGAATENGKESCSARSSC